MFAKKPLMKIAGQGKTPQRSYNSAGYDIFAYLSEPITIEPSSRAVIPTGIHIELDTEQNVYIQIAPRSGLAVNHGIHVMGGIVDRDYTGEIKVILFNSNSKPFTVRNEDKIAQFIIKNHHVFDIERVESLSQTERGSNGFGSTDNPIFDNHFQVKSPESELPMFSQDKSKKKLDLFGSTEPMVDFSWEKCI